MTSNRRAADRHGHAHRAETLRRNVASPGASPGTRGAAQGL